MNPKIFKAYDIRGIYPEEIDGETAFLAGQAYANMTKAKKVAVGRDMRIGSEEIAMNFINGLNDQGVNVDDLGLVSIDAVYFAVGQFDYDGGAMITASHNPKEYNGIKMFISDDGISMISGKELFAFLDGKKFLSATSKGLVSARDIIPEYLEHVLSFVDLQKVKPFKIVVDAGNGMAGKIMPLLFDKLPCELVPLNFSLDGNFPAHPSNPLMPESQIEICKKVVEEKADFGIIMDGDTDRLFFVTEKGDFVRADITLLLLAKKFLKHNPEAGIAYNLICSRAVPEKIKEWGGVPLRSRVGFVFVSRRMKEGRGVMGGEVSAHYSFRDNFYADSGFIAFMILLSLISEENRKLSEIIEGLNPYSRFDEINIKTDNSEETIKKLKDKFTEGEQDELDGLTVQFDKWWFNARPSNTEPLLRITIEGETKELAEEKRDELLKVVEG